MWFSFGSTTWEIILSTPASSIPDLEQRQRSHSAPLKNFSPISSRNSPEPSCQLQLALTRWELQPTQEILNRDLFHSPISLPAPYRINNSHLVSQVLKWHLGQEPLLIGLLWKPGQHESKQTHFGTNTFWHKKRNKLFWAGGQVRAQAFFWLSGGRRALRTELSLAPFNSLDRWVWIIKTRQWAHSRGSGLSSRNWSDFRGCVRLLDCGAQPVWEG